MVNESFETGPENIDNSPSENSSPEIQRDENQTPQVDPQKLKGIYEKITTKPNSLWERDVSLDTEELKEVKALEYTARQQLDDLTKDNPLWDKFIALEKENIERGNMLPTTGYGTTEKGHYDNFILVNERATDVRRVGNQPEVPPDIASLIAQRNRLDRFQAAYRNMHNHSHTAASGFAWNMKEGYRFYKEHKEETPAETSVSAVNEEREEVDTPQQEPLRMESIETDLDHYRIRAESQAKEGRDHNEDFILVNNEKRLYGVFDGVGDREGGEQASKEAAEIIESAMGTKFSNVKHMRESLERAVERADIDLKIRNVGFTTVTVAKIWEQEGQSTLVYANVGDSRLFVLRNGKLNQLTIDDSVTELAVQSGSITKEQAELVDQAISREDLPDEKLRTLFSRRNKITNSLGTGQNAVVEAGVFHLQPGDRFIMTSDGIHDNLPKHVIEALAISNKELANDLIDSAYSYSKGGYVRSKKDDMSALVIEVVNDELREKLEPLIEDPDEFQELAKSDEVINAGPEITEVVEAFDKKYSNWPGQEEEDRQIGEYLGSGEEGSRWYQEVGKAYEELFPGEEHDKNKWEELAMALRLSLRISRLDEYRKKGAL